MPEIPDPTYVRYTGPGAQYTVRWTLGPYRALTEAPQGVPVAVPPDVADTLTAYSPFEAVDPVEAVAEIVEHDQRLAAEQTQWEAQQAEQQARRRRERDLREIEGGRIEAMQIAARTAREAGGSQAEIVAAAAAASAEFLAGLGGLQD